MTVLSNVGHAASSPLLLNIPSQSLATALNELARQSGIEIIYFSEVLRQAEVSALEGQYSFDDALTVLLKGTGLTFKPLERDSVFIVSANNAGDEISAPASANLGSTSPHADETNEVIVTARRREENEMDVPFSIDALVAGELAERNIDSLLLANGFFRNVSIRTDPFSGAAGLEIGMRGINRAVLYQDGVPIRFGAMPSTLDIERIEVMRGPQGTLFGPSAIGGAIQAVTSKPDSKLFGTVEVTAGSFDRRDLSLKINSPITGNWAASLTAAALNRDGFVTSTATQQSLGSKHDRFYRLDSLWKLTAGTEVRLQYARHLNESNGQAYVNYRLDAVCPGDPVPPGYRTGDGEQRFFAPNAYCILSRVDLDPLVAGLQPYSEEFHSYGKREIYANTIRSEQMGWWQKINDVKVDWRTQINSTSSVRALLSRRWGTENSTEDLDGTGLDIFQNNLNALQEHWDLRTGEVQFLYNHRRLSGILGIYGEHSPGALQKRLSWVHNELTIPEIRDAAEAAYPGSTDFRIRPESAPFNTAQFFRISQLRTSQWAAFSEWSWAVNDKLKLTAGIRFTRQENERIRYRPGSAGAANMPPVRCCNLDPGINYYEPTGPAERVQIPAYSQLTPRLSIQQAWSANFMAYLSYAKGGNIGGVDINPPPGSENNSYRPEEVHTLEGGIRIRTLFSTTQLHLGGFYSKYNDIQISEEIFPGTLRTGNAQAKIYGLELEGTSSIAPWRINYGIGWLNAHYTDVGTTINLMESAPFAYAPDFSFTYGIAYERQWGPFGVLARLDHTWQAETITSTDPTLAQPVPSRGLLSARLELRPMGEAWSIALSGTNLNQEFYFTNGFLLPADQSFAGTMGRPREWSLTLGIRFE